MKHHNNKITIENLSHDGRGIGHLSGKTHFIANALPKEIVFFNYLRKNKKYAEGIAHEISVPSNDRIAPVCPHFSMCGGCQTQHISKKDQLKYKQKTVLELIKHIGHTAPITILPPISEKEYHYRTKARLGVKYVQKKEKVLVGFREVNGRYIADITQCPILISKVGNKIQALSKLIENLSCRDKIPQIEVAASEEATALIFRHLEALTKDDIDQLIAFGKTHNFMICLQPGNYETIHQIYPQKNEPALYYDIPNHQIRIAFHPSDFTQVNYAVNCQMIDSAIDLLDLQGDDELLDLFCGLGNFSLPVGRYVKAITGIEGDSNMVEKAKVNAVNNGIDNATFHVANLFENISHYHWARKKYSKIILDPPRAGAEEIARNINQFSANKIVYISCNPSTLARDTHEITKQGYTLAKLGIINMFPQTAHVETIALFQKL